MAIQKKSLIMNLSATKKAIVASNLVVPTSESATKSPAARTPASRTVF